MRIRISDVLRPLERGGLKCVTCSNPDWSRLIREVLDQIIEGDAPFNTSDTQICAALREDFEQLGCAKYPYKVSTLSQHIRNHETERWRARRQINR